MSETSNNAKAKLEAARLKAEQLRLMQEEVARELAEAEALEAAQTREQEREKAKRETEALHRATEKERLRRVRLNKQGAADASVGTRSSSGKSARKRLGLHCFNCNRYEGHYLSFYRRLWYSYVIGMTFGLAIVIGPYRCQCCGSSRLMMSNLLHPKYYIAVSRLRSKKRSRSSRRKSSRG
jgi:hypothetical protein